MKIPYRDLRVRDPQLKAELLQAIDTVLSHGRLIHGPELQHFETEVAAYAGRAYGVGVGSGSDALYLALRGAGVGPGDEVITTALSWIATTNAIVMTGATPVFVDIASDLNIDASLISEAVTPKTKAIVPVHFTGQMCDMRRVLAIAAKSGLLVIEDSAQAFGATRDGLRSGASGIAGCFSMNPMKVFNAYGEAGAIVVDDEALRDVLRSLRYSGTVGAQDCHYPSLNGRLDTLQAAMLLVNIKYVEQRIERRRAIAAEYQQALGNVVTCPVEHSGSRHTYYAYTILADRRDELQAFLAERGIETQIQHRIPMPLHTAYKARFCADIPICENIVQRILCLPNSDVLTSEMVAHVAECVCEFYRA